MSTSRLSNSLLAVVAVSLVFASLAAPAQRLPDGARPLHYSLKLTPNLASATFAGEEAIDATLARPANAITLNAIEIKFNQVTAGVGGRTLPADVSLDSTKEQATFHFKEMLPAGPVTLHVSYSGILNSELRGFYLSKTAKRNYAVTQFEPTDARRAFPSFDEPALKATYDVTLVVSKGDTAISNTNIVSDTPGPGSGEHTIRFARTPKMSTYLVAFLVGDFQCLSGKSDGIPIRVCATPDQVQNGAYALSAAKYFLHHYDNYFGIKYPMPKLDMIALPDFEAGAMENFGAITYRERALLVDPKTATVGAEMNVAVDVAHEMAHQWFGDMVTMNWWDNIWLNEGFATWMESKAVAAWKPEWKIPEESASDMNDTLDLDARETTRAIQAKADTPAEINEMFDGITYDKTAAVLLMVENYVGPETFRQGVHAYLAAHMYANATAQDFWDAQTTVSQKPVDKIMGALVKQPGEPLLTFGPVNAGKDEVAQQRFFLNPKTTDHTNPQWDIPVCFKGEGAPDCEMLTGRREDLKVPQAAVFYGNANGKGYYRSRYDAKDYQALVRQAESGLNPEERITLVGSEWALARSEKATIGDFMSLAGAVKDDRSPYVVETIASAIEDMDQRLASTTQEHQMLAAWVRKNFTAPLARLGEPGPADTPQTKMLRATLFVLLGRVGEDSAVIAQAKQLSLKYFENPSSVDPNLAVAALQVAAQNGDAAFFDRLQKVSETAATPQLYSEALFALTLFRDPALVKRALQYAVSGKVKNQDSALMIASELGDRATQGPAWMFIGQNWPAVKAQTTITTGERLVAAAGDFCSAEQRKDVAAFFAQHPVPASASDLSRAENRIDDCIELRSAQGANLKNWLEANGGSQPSGERDPR